MESNDEFQFRPITRGLGFHSQSESAQPPAAKSPASPKTLTAQERAEAEARGQVTAESVSRLISSLPTLDFIPPANANPQARASAQRPAGGQPASKLIHTPLGRAPQAPNAAAAPTAASVPPRAPTAATASLQASAIPGIPARDRQRASTPLSNPSATPKKSAFPKWSVPNLKFISSALELRSSRAPAVENDGAIQGSIAGVIPATPSNAVATATAIGTAASARKAPTVVIDEIKFRETPVQLSAALFDLLVVAGLTCIFAVALLLVTSTDLSLVIRNAQSDWATRAGILLLFFSVHALYMVGSRSVAGCTLGEWAFDIQLGLPTQQVKAWYPLAICLRYIVTVLTGYITLPILSMIMGTDIASNLCGLKLYQIVK